MGVGVWVWVLWRWKQPSEVNRPLLSSTARSLRWISSDSCSCLSRPESGMIFEPESLYLPFETLFASVFPGPLRPLP